MQEALIDWSQLTATSITPFSTSRIDWTYDELGRLIEEVRDEGDDDVF